MGWLSALWTAGIARDNNVPYAAEAKTIGSAVHTVDSQTPRGGNVAAQRRSGIDWGKQIPAAIGRVALAEKEPVA